VQWVAAGLLKALTPTKIIKGFYAKGIWLLRAAAIDEYMGPSSCYSQVVHDQNSNEEQELQDAATRRVGMGTVV